MGVIYPYIFDAFESGFYGQADLPAVEEACKQYGVQVVLINMDVPEWNEVNRGYLADPNLKDEFKRRLEEALEVAIRVKTLKLMLPVGVEIPHQIGCV